MELKDKISSDLNISPSFIDEAIKYSHSRIRKIHIAKRNGGQRIIYLPYSKVKTIQYWLIHNVFEKLPVHKCAMAYRKGLSVLENAKKHKNSKYFLKTDLKSFFPSIIFDDLLAVMASWHTKNSIEWALNYEAKDIIRKCCFGPDGKLPIGYSSSPSISNAVMRKFDIDLVKAVSDKTLYGTVVYTRYADDIIISTNKANVCKKILTKVKKTVKDNVSPKIQINLEKTSLASSTGGTAFVTGLRICAAGKITIHKKHKDHIRLLLALLVKDKLDILEYESLRGHLSYIRHVDPAFYTKICNKYLHALEKLHID